MYREMKRSAYIIAAVGIIVILLFARVREGYDDYLDAMLKDRGYSGVRVAPANPKPSSALLTSTYFCPDGTVKSTHKFNNCLNELAFPPTHIDNPYTTRELADGQVCVRDNDCYSKNCSGGLCTSESGSGYSPTGFYCWFIGGC